MYKGDNQLREYQFEGVNWLTFCYYNRYDERTLIIWKLLALYMYATTLIGENFLNAVAPRDALFYVLIIECCFVEDLRFNDASYIYL